MRILLILVIALLPSFADAQNIFGLGKKKTDPTMNSRLPDSAPNNAPSAALQNGDIIQMRLSGPPEEYTREFAIEQLSVDDGMVSVPMIGRVKAAGLTPAQLGSAIEKQLIAAKIFTVANVNINTMAQQRFIIAGGAVRGPGRQLWSQGLTLTAAISAAQGPAEWAEDTVRLIRNGQVFKYSRKAIKADPKLDPKLLPSDVIEVEGEF
jgi:polysaccharide export outer membrane protein